MNQKGLKTLDQRVQSLRRRCPWLASFILHCLETRDPRAVEATRLMLTRLRLNKRKNQ